MDQPVRRAGRHITRPNVIQLRLSDAGLAAVDELADEEQRTRSDMIRLLLADGMQARRTRR